MWYLIVSIPDLCNLTYFGIINQGDISILFHKWIARAYNILYASIEQISTRKYLVAYVLNLKNGAFYKCFKQCTNLFFLLYTILSMTDFALFDVIQDCAFRHINYDVA